MSSPRIRHSMSEFTRPAQETLEAAREYADSKADELKLQVAKGLSESVTRIITILVLVLVASTLLLVLSFGLILLLGQICLCGAPCGGRHRHSAGSTYSFQGQAVPQHLRSRFRETVFPSGR